MNQAMLVFLDGLRRQSFSVVLTLAGLLALGWWNLIERRSCQNAITALEIEMDSCSAHRLLLSVEVGRLRERVNLLSSVPARKK